MYKYREAEKVLLSRLYRLFGLDYKVHNVDVVDLAGELSVIAMENRKIVEIQWLPSDDLTKSKLYAPNAKVLAITKDYRAVIGKINQDVLTPCKHSYRIAQDLDLRFSLQNDVRALIFT